MSTITNLTLDVLTEFKGFVQDNDVQVQTIQVFLKIASSSMSPSMQELVKTTGIGLSAVSRNIKKLAIGYGVINITLDPVDSRNRIMTLTPKGQELVARLETVAKPHIHYMMKREVAP